MLYDIKHKQLKLTTMKTKMTKSEKLQKDIKFIKSVASDYGISLTDEQAKKAIKICGNDYYRMKEYFIN
jgi:predicted transcriptional regulator